MRTEQEEFWAGEFGNEYLSRIYDRDTCLASNLTLFSKILANIDKSKIKSFIEFGANVGLNIVALKMLLPGIDFSGIEINEQAVNELKKLDKIKIYHKSVLDFEADYKRDLLLTKGLLIHINPDELSKLYDILYQTANNYICIVEYYNLSPVEVDYRGHKGKLFKRDFPGELMDRFKDLKLIDYGFVYYRDSNFLPEDLNWFLLEKYTKK